MATRIIGRSISTWWSSNVARQGQKGKHRLYCPENDAAIRQPYAKMGEPPSGLDRAEHKADRLIGPLRGII